MFKRTWPVMCLLGTLCLATSSLHANESPFDSGPGLQSTARSSDTGRALGTKSRPATPSIPTGDDDTPNRTGNGGGSRGQMGGTTPGLTSEAVDRSGWKMRDLLADMRGWWIRYASVNR